jgi:succinoglycan biosynthesis transport protein ExoP
LASFDESYSQGGSGAQSPDEGVSLLSALRRRLLVIVLTTILVGGAAAAFAYATRNTYQTTAELLFDQTIGAELNALGLIPPTPSVDKLAADNAAFVSSRRVAILTAHNLGHGTTVDSVQNDITVPPQTTSDVIKVVATGNSPQRVAQVSNAYAAAAIELARRDQARRTAAIVSGLTVQLNKLDVKHDPTAIGLKAKIAEVAALGSSGTGVPHLIQAGFVPTSKSGNPIQTVLLGTLFGVLLGVGLALLREQTDRRLRYAGEVSAAFEAPVLATVPNNRALARHVPFANLPPEVSEAFLMVQAHLRYGRAEPIRSVLVTSSRGQQGKTTIAWNLACAAASSGLSTMLVDADLRRSSLAAEYDLQPFPGLGEVLRGDVAAAHATQRVPLMSPDGPPNGHGALTVLVAGFPPPDPSALVQSEQMGALLSSLKLAYDLVIVDTPPIARVSDAISLLGRVDGVIIAASVNSTSGPEAAQLRDQLQAFDASVVGVVANGGSTPTGGYAYVASPAQVV